MSRHPIPPVERLLGQGTAPATITAFGPDGNDPTDTPARVLVTGSRDLTTPGPVHQALTRAWIRIGRPIVVVHGACPRGADDHAQVWADLHAVAGITAERWPADWSAWGRAAGPIRNGAMVEAGPYAAVLAFPLPGSRGTWDCVRQARRAGYEPEIHEATR